MLMELKRRKALMDMEKAAAEGKEIPLGSPEQSLKQPVQFEPHDDVGLDGRQLKPAEKLIFHILKNSEKKYGVSN